MAYQHHTKQRRIALLGHRASGKSQILARFTEASFLEAYHPTIQNTSQKTIRWEGGEWGVEVMDTAGQDEYSIMKSEHAVGLHGYMLAYSITSKASFEMLTIIRDKILNYTGTEWIPIVIVGNKCDLESLRQVPLSSVQLLALRWKCGHIETSAKQNTNILRAFELMLEQIERGPMKDKRSKKCLIS